MENVVQSGNMWPMIRVLKYVAPCVLFLTLVSAAQVGPASGAIQSGMQLSKDYRKSAISAMSSVDDWNAKAKQHSNSEGDAQRNASKDVRLANVDVATPGDAFIQRHLETYYKVSNVLIAYVHGMELSSDQLQEKVMTQNACQDLITKALDEGTTAAFDRDAVKKCE
jgi:hypothetical protein